MTGFDKEAARVEASWVTDPVVEGNHLISAIGPVITERRHPDYMDRRNNREDECRDVMVKLIDRVAELEASMLKTVRPEIADFARAMEAKMATHDADRGDSWKECVPGFFQDRLLDEMDEWASAVCGLGRANEAADIGNFAMMAWWVAMQEAAEELKDVEG